jgi:hypothetical protein
MNSKRLQLTTVYILTLKGDLACAIFDFDITSAYNERLVKYDSDTG